jgi:hypothetical protein
LATVTGGTTGTGVLTGVLVQPALASLPNPSYAMGAGGIIPVPADFAAIDNAILDDINPAHPIYGANNGLTPQGLLFVPNRGVLRCRPGDYIFYDPATGWPILVSGRAAAGAQWTHT